MNALERKTLCQQQANSVTGLVTTCQNRGRIPRGRGSSPFRPHRISEGIYLYSLSDAYDHLKAALTDRVISPRALSLFLDDSIRSNDQSLFVNSGASWTLRHFAQQYLRYATLGLSALWTLLVAHSGPATPLVYPCFSSEQASDRPHSTPVNRQHSIPSSSTSTTVPGFIWTRCRWHVMSTGSVRMF